jgi:hypothetical protein
LLESGAYALQVVFQALGIVRVAQAVPVGVQLRGRLLVDAKGAVELAGKLQPLLGGVPLPVAAAHGLHGQQQFGGQQRVGSVGHGSECMGM